MSTKRYSKNFKRRILFFSKSNALSFTLLYYIRNFLFLYIDLIFIIIYLIRLFNGNQQNNWGLGILHLYGNFILQKTPEYIESLCSMLNIIHRTWTGSIHAIEILEFVTAFIKKIEIHSYKHFLEMDMNVYYTACFTSGTVQRPFSFYLYIMKTNNSSLVLLKRVLKENYSCT